MGRDVHDARVVPEDVLGPVAVVDVPVDDEHPLTTRGERGGGDGNVVEEAEALTPGAGRMVPRRSFHDERCRALSAVERVDRGESRACREQRGRERAARHRCVGIEAAPARSRELLERVDVVEVVHPGERVAVDGVARRAHEGVAELRVLDPAPHRVEPRRLFGVVAARVVAVLTAERRHHDLVHSSLTAVQGTCLLHCSLATSRDTRLAHARSRAAARSAAPTLALLASDAGRRGPSALVRASPVRHARVRARLRLRPGPCSLRTGNRDARARCHQRHWRTPVSPPSAARTTDASSAARFATGGTRSCST